METITSLPPPLNPDAVAFCPYAGWEDLMACGCYELVPDETPPRRIGRLSLLSATAAEGLTERCSLDDTGILDCAWLPEAASQASGKRLLAVATSSCDARIYSVQRRQGSSGAPELEPEPEPESEETARATSMIEVSKLPCDGAGEACMGLAWSLDVAAPRIALSGTSGLAYLGELGGGGLRPLATWQAHELEGWSVAFDCNDVHTLYTGADDAILKRWDLRCVGAGGGDADDEPPTDPVATASNRRSHRAGVCCISPNPTRPHLVATGSYDETARLWDVRNLRMPVAEAECGGGVWRLKWHPEEGGLLLAACMHAGFAVLHVDGLPADATSAEGGGSDAPDAWSGLSLDVTATYDAHGLGAKGLGYGADWAWGHRRHRAQSSLGEADDRALVGATCSFYDRQLHLWQLSASRARAAPE